MGYCELHIDRFKPVFFIERKTVLPELNVPFHRKPVEMKSFKFEPVDAIYFNSQRDLFHSADKLKTHSIPVYESDIRSPERYLMENLINGSALVSGEIESINGHKVIRNPKIKAYEFETDFRITSIDIETGVADKSLYSIAMHTYSKSTNERIVFMRSDQQTIDGLIHYCLDEHMLLVSFIDYIQKLDPDILIGWHVIGFDLMFLQNKFHEHGLPFHIGRNQNRVTLQQKKSGVYVAHIPGRIVLDGPQLLRAAFYRFDDFKLETVARKLLGKGKAIDSNENKIKEIDRQFNEDKKSLAAYNIQDCELVSEIFQRTGILEMSIKRTLISGMLLDQLGMSASAFDHFFLPRLHRSGYVAIDTKDVIEGDHAAGGFVLEPVTGIHEHVIVVDFKSLYPSIIKTFKIDPLSRLLKDQSPVRTPSGHFFSRQHHLLPELIDELFEKRSKAKLENDNYLSQAIKILMNSFYGVMGSFGCRFYHPDLPAAITETGQYLLKHSKIVLERNGYTVIYGDTDSLFVQLKESEINRPEQAGETLAAFITEYWLEKCRDDFSVESFLVMEYDDYYEKLHMPEARIKEGGAKKRYVGYREIAGKAKLNFVGMEAVRSDWTKLAKRFQHELYQRLFRMEEIDQWMLKFIEQIKSGEFNAEMVYHKRLKKPVSEYTSHIPPQIKAAQLLGKPVREVDYVITKRGPIPIQLPHEDPDYHHYLDKQIRPIANTALHPLGKSYQSITETQLSLF